jgi:hypothetical protein
MERRGADRLDVKFLFAAEVMIKKALGNAGLRRHVVDRDVLVGARGEELDAELDELDAALVDLEADARRGRLARRAGRLVGAGRPGFARTAAGVSGGFRTGYGPHNDALYNGEEPAQALRREYQAEIRGAAAPHRVG